MASTRGGWAGGSRAGPAVRGSGLGEDAAGRLRAENAALQDKVAELQAALAAIRVGDAGLEEAARLRADNEGLAARLIESEARVGDVEALRAELAEALRRNEERRQDRRALDREIVEMRSMLAEAERQLANVRQTFIYRIGDAIVAARTWKGLRGLPRRLFGLRRAFLEKRGLAGSAVQQRRLAERLRYVEEALKVLTARGVDAAVAHVRSMPDRHVEEKARTLVELALAVRVDDPVRAGDLGVEAAGLNDLEPRLRALVLALFDQGEVEAPARILSGVAESFMSRPADVTRRETILPHRRQLAEPQAFPKPAAGGHAGSPRLAVISPRSLPQHAEAMTFRAQAVVDAVRDAGNEALLITAPGYQYPKTGDGGPVTRKVGPLEVIRLGSGDSPPDAFDGFVAETGAALAAVFLRHRISHVHALAGTPLASAALWGARRAGAGFTLDIGVIPTFGPASGEGGEGAWEATERFRAGLSLFRDTARSADHVIVRSPALARELARSGVAGTAVVVEDALPTGFARASAASVRDIRRELGLAEQRLIGVFEPLDGDEGLADVVSALPSVRAVHPDAAIVFCGSGKAAQTLQRLAARLDLADHVLIPTGFVRQRTADYLSAFSVAVFPKRRQHAAGLSAPFELQAALAVGAPVAAVENAWSQDWIVDGENGLLTPPGDVEALGGAILRCLDDPALVDRLGKAALESVQARSRRTIVDPPILATLTGAAGRAAA